MELKRPVPSPMKRLGAFCLGLLLLVAAYYAPIETGLFRYRLKGGLAAFGLLLTAGNCWMMYRERMRRRPISR
jgi:hypothetical protein